MAGTNRATGSFKVPAWDEGPYAGHEGAPKLALARVTSSYTGDIEGEGSAHSVMCYSDADAIA